MSDLIVLDEHAVKRLQKAVSSNCVLVVWVADWLAHLNLFSDAQIYAILNFFKPEIERFETEVSSGVDRDIITLAVCDSRWVSLTGIPTFFDAETSEFVPELHEFAVTHIMCDIAALRRRMLYRQELFNGPSKSDVS
jgi:hypothetical protein|tara:strand:+ start:821 stop:1231 length:411 start_codon:yes stop_codon:yes gene_type:complete